MITVGHAKDRALSALISEYSLAIKSIDDLILRTDAFSDSDLELLTRVKLNLANRITVFSAAIR